MNCKKLNQIIPQIRVSKTYKNKLLDGNDVKDNIIYTLCDKVTFFLKLLLALAAFGRASKKITLVGPTPGCTKGFSRRTPFYVSGLQPLFKQIILVDPTPMCTKIFFSLQKNNPSLRPHFKKITLVDPTPGCTKVFSRRTSFCVGGFRPRLKKNNPGQSNNGGLSVPTTVGST